MTDNVYSKAFDELAPRYDREFVGRPGAHVLRELIWEELRSAFHPGNLVLDIGCGTGEDALFLAKQGVRVLATDVSTRMVQEAEIKLRPHQALVTLAVCDAFESSPLLERHLAPGSKLDGILSNFGALNCLSSLEPIYGLADQYVKPGGYLFLCLINRFYLRETARCVFRRFRSNGTPVPCGSQMIPLYYHPSRQLRWPGYEFRKLSGLAVFFRSDVWKRWPLNRCGDHYLVVLRKRVS